MATCEAAILISARSLKAHVLASFSPLPCIAIHELYASVPISVPF